MNTIPLYLGRTEFGERVYASPSAINPHTLIIGLAGSGKTTELNILEMYLAYKKSTVIAASYSQTHNINNIYKQFQDPFQRLTNLIDVKTNGLPFSLWPTHPDDIDTNSTLLDTSSKTMSCQELMEDDVGSVFSILASTSDFGPIQHAKIREILKEAYDERFSSQNQFDPIREILEDIIDGKRLPASGKKLSASDKKILYSIADRLYNLLHRVKIDPASSNGIERGKINIVSLDSYDSNIQKECVDLLLGLIWNKAKSNPTKGDTTYIVLDEFQELNFRKDTPFYALLREGRKFNIGLIMATQEYHSFKAEQRTLINQAATKIYFRLAPSEAQAISRQLTQDKTQQERYMDLLTNLPRGKCLVTGELVTDSRSLNGPVLVDCKI